MFNLELDISYDFMVVAISSNQRPYTLCWAINSELNSELRMTENFVLKNKTSITEYKRYTSEKEGFFFHFLGNKSGNQRLVPEMPTVDYFIKIFDEDCPFSGEELVSSLRKIKFVQAVYSMDVNKLKSKQVFIFD